MTNPVHPGTHPSRKTGKRRPDPSRKAVPFASLLQAPFAHAVLPVHPDVWPIPAVTVWGEDENDKWGCCVVAMIDHLLTAQAAVVGVVRAPWTRDEILAYYRTQNPDFDPAGSADTNGPGSLADGGMNEQAFLELLVKQGVISGFAKVDHTNPDELAAAAYYGVAIATGVVVDQAQMAGQFDQGVWDYVAGSPEEGGHAIPVVGKPRDPVCITWGKPVALTGTFIAHQMDEAWFVLTPFLVDHPSVRALNLQAFADAVAAITDGKVQVTVAPAPAPVVVPPGAATFPVAGDLVDHIARASHRAHPALTPAQWMDRLLRAHFRLAPEEYSGAAEAIAAGDQALAQLGVIRRHLAAHDLLQNDVALHDQVRRALEQRASLAETGHADPQLEAKLAEFDAIHAHLMEHESWLAHEGPAALVKRLLDHRRRLADKTGDHDALPPHPDAS